MDDRSSGHQVWGSLQKENSYERIGLYVNMPKHGPVSLADVHLRWLTQVSGPRNKPNHFADFVDAYFAGPFDSINQIKVLRRSRADIDLYQRAQKVSPDLDIENGGYAKVVDTNNFIGLEISKRFTNQPAHIWLFGPLTFLGMQYGSLFLTLQGKFTPGQGFQKLDIRGSSYAEGPDQFPLPRNQSASPEEKAAAYAKRVSETFPVPFPPTAHRWTWKIECYRRHLTGSAMSDMRDTATNKL
jgi:hypothetical protein